MREIKFRAWDLETKKMYDVEKIIFFGSISIVPDRFEYREPDNSWDKNRVVLMQHTGHKDKNDKEAYVLDIFQHNKNKYIIIDTINFGIIAVTINKNLGDIITERLLKFKHYYQEFNWLYRVNKHWEIIGNALENPELLNQ